MVFTGFALGTWLSMRQARKAGLDPNVIIDVVMWILISSIIGARLTYVAFHPDEFAGRWLDVVNPFQSDGRIGIAGLVVLGGFVTAVPAVWWFARRRKLSTLFLLDILAPGAALGIGLGRLGCFLNGCCFGHPTDLPWGVVFPTGCMAGAFYPHQPIHPTQLYEFIYSLGIAAFLLWKSRQIRFQGELIVLLLILYGFFRFGNETVRYYETSMVLFTTGTFRLTLSMLISSLMVVSGVIIWIHKSRNRS